MKFSNEVALETGASFGIGLAAARLFLEAGCRVAGSVRDEKRKRELLAVSPERLPVQLDVTSPE
jgi:NAD(P)-dependent dehydrogenase (short-subunit alcohol dehydrogenase family)